jgi:hypothetical protein
VNVLGKRIGWGFFLEHDSKISAKKKFQQQINSFNEEKRKWKEEEIQKMSESWLSSMAASLFKQHKEAYSPHSTIHYP